MIRHTGHGCFCGYCLCFCKTLLLEKSNSRPGGLAVVEVPMVSDEKCAPAYQSPRPVGLCGPAKANGTSADIIQTAGGGVKLGLRGGLRSLAATVLDKPLGETTSLRNDYLESVPRPAKD